MLPHLLQKLEYRSLKQIKAAVLKLVNCFWSAQKTKVFLVPIHKWNYFPARHR